MFQLRPLCTQGVLSFRTRGIRLLERVVTLHSLCKGHLPIADTLAHCPSVSMIQRFHCINVIVIAWGQGFMAVNRPKSEGVARGQGWFTLP